MSFLTKDFPPVKFFYNNYSSLCRKNNSCRIIVTTKNKKSSFAFRISKTGGHLARKLSYVVTQLGYVYVQGFYAVVKLLAARDYALGNVRHVCH